MGWDAAPDESDTSEEGERVGELRDEQWHGSHGGLGMTN
jgi:hypothetical protein